MSQSSTDPPDGAPKKKEAKRALEDEVERISDLQRDLFAEDRRSLLLVFQAMDAAGKDSTIRAVTTGVNPAGFQVASFKAPSKRELDHDFLWRVAKSLPERGRIGIFNRSHYEETLVVRVHPEYLESQRVPGSDDLPRLWEERFDSIRDFERHLARNGTTIVKFWLNVSRAEQRSRFLDRIDEADKNWKFNAGDLAEAELWEEYMQAYEATLRATSRDHAPWYAIPADEKPFLRLSVARIVRETLEAMAPAPPELGEDERRELAELGERLRAEARRGDAD